MTKALVDALPDTLAKVEAETLGETLGDIKFEDLIHGSNDTVAEANAQTL